MPQIADRHPSLAPAVLAAAEEAVAGIARFDVRTGGQLTSFAAVLLRTESASSSRIEQLTSGAKAIAVAELGAPSTRNAGAIVGNVHAMQAAIDLADEPTADSILAMHEALLHDSEPAIAGRWRTQQVWIGGDSYGPHGAEYVAPVRSVTVPVSAGLLTDVEGYFSALSAYRAGDLDPVVAAFTNSTFVALTTTAILVEELRAARNDWDDAIRAHTDSSAWRVADLLLRQPVLDSSAIVRELGIPPQNAVRALAPLLDAGVLTEFTGRQRNRMWQARDMLDALDAFAARAGRRTRG